MFVSANHIYLHMLQSHFFHLLKQSRFPEKIKFKRADGRTGTCTWQSIYNRMHESGLIKEVNEDKDGEVKTEADVDQEEEVVALPVETEEV